MIKYVFSFFFSLIALQAIAQTKITPYWESQIDDEKQIIVLKTINVAVNGNIPSKTVYIHLLLDAQDISAYQYIGYIEIEPSSLYLLSNKNLQLTFNIPSNVQRKNYSSFILCFNYDKTLSKENVIDKVIIPRDIWIQNYSYQAAQALAASAIDNPILMMTNLSEMNNLISRHSTNIVWTNNYPIISSQTPNCTIPNPAFSGNHSTTTSQQPCWCCNGTGYCHICSGKGTVGDKKCPSCHGTTRCQYCNGTGIFHPKY